MRRFSNKKYLYFFRRGGFLAVFLSVFLLCPNLLFSAEKIDPVKGNIIVFPVIQRSIEMKAVINESVRSIKSALNRMGRFIPVETNRAQNAIDAVLEKSNRKVYYKTAQLLGVDIYILVSAYRIGERISSEVRVISLSDKYKKLQGAIVVNSRIAANIPPKIVREIAYLHKDLKLFVKAIKKLGSNTYLINAGQWHGINPGKYYTEKGSAVNIIRTGRYRSVASFGSKISLQEFAFPLYPRIQGVIEDAEKKIKINTEFRYGLGATLLKGGNPEKKLIEGACIINIGSNLCIPGYGSFLSTRYLGFETANPDVPGVLISSGLILTHFTLSGILTGFKTNFFPGINDGEKGRSVKNLQYFLWFSLPVLFTASYFDQLAYQFEKDKRLPPFFDDSNSAALIMSLLFPGGGLFFKGYRLAGWSYYLSEMILAGYGVYTYKEGKKWKYAFISLGVIKLIEIASAYFIKPSYDFYNLEMDRGSKRNIMSIGLDRGINNENIYRIALSYLF